MQLGENIIAASGITPFFSVANAADVGLSAPEKRKGDAVRCWVRSLSGFQKEALVVSARSGLMWRLVSDEGAYLNGHTGQWLETAAVRHLLFPLQEHTL